MSSQNSLFSFGDVTFSDCGEMDGEEFTRMFSDEEDVQKRFEMTRSSIADYLDRLSENSRTLKDFNDFVQSCLNELCQNILDACKDAMEKYSSPSDSVKVKDNLTLFIDFLKMLESIETELFLKRSNRLTEVQDIILIISFIILRTFQFCIESCEKYKNQLCDSGEMVQIFKQNSDVFTKFLKTCESHLEVETTNQGEIEALQQNNIAVVGEISSGINVKVYTDAWKNYTLILNKHASILGEKYNIGHSVSFLCSETTKTLQKVLEMDSTNTKTITNTLKAGYFILKVIIKLRECFYEKVSFPHDILVKFLFEIYKYSPVHLRYQDYPKKTTDLIKISMFNLLEEFCLELAKDKHFLKDFCEATYPSDTLPYFLAIMAILPSIPSSYNQQIYQRSAEDVGVFFKKIFKVIQDIFGQYLDTRLEFEPKKQIFNNLIENLVCLGLVLPQTEYIILEEILLDNILNHGVFCSIFASTVWILMLKHSQAKLCFDTMCKLIDSCEDLLKQHISVSQEYLFFQNLLKNMYKTLTIEYKGAFRKKYDFSKQYIHVWRCIGIGDVDSLERIFSKIEKLTDDLMKSNISSDDFMYLCSLLQASSVETAPRQICDFKIIPKLWSLVNSKSDSNALWTLFMKSLGKITKPYFLKLHISDQELIMNRLKNLSNEDFSKMMMIYITQSSPNNVIEKYGLTNLLLSDGNPIIRQMAKSLFSKVEEPLSNFDNKDVYFKKLCETCSFSHKCIEWSNNFVHPHKKIRYNAPELAKNIPNKTNIEKSAPDDDNDQILREMSGDVSGLIGEIKKYTKSLSKNPRTSFSSKDMYQIKSVINQLQNIFE